MNNLPLSRKTALKSIVLRFFYGIKAKKNLSRLMPQEVSLAEAVGFEPPVHLLTIIYYSAVFCTILAFPRFWFVVFLPQMSYFRLYFYGFFTVFKNFTVQISV